MLLRNGVSYYPHQRGNKSIEKSIMALFCDRRIFINEMLEFDSDQYQVFFSYLAMVLIIYLNVDQLSFLVLDVFRILLDLKLP